MPIIQLLKHLAGLRSVTAVFVAIVLLQVAVAAVSIDMLSSVRGYVAAESLYSKGQKDALLYLKDYIQSRNELDYQQFIRALNIPLGDRAAREALELPVPDKVAARLRLLAGGNDDEDVGGMIRLFVCCHNLPFMAKAIAIWREADDAIDEMHDLVERARPHIYTGDLGADAVREMNARTPLLNERLSRLERNFSDSLGMAAREAQRWLIGVNLAVALILVAMGGGFLRRSWRIFKEREALEASNLARTEFLSRMSHELRTPLNAVLGFATLLRTDTAATLNVQLERVRHIEDAGQHLLALVNDILDLARAESGHLTLSLETVNLGEVVDEALALVTPMAQLAEVTFRAQGADLNLSRPASKETRASSFAKDVWLIADRLRLRQVLVNVMSNAVKYNRPGGYVAFDYKQTAESCVLSISDTGVGMTARQMNDLFQPFNRLGAERSRVEGVGIGLVLSRGLLEAMGGGFAIESAAGQGTVAKMKLSLSSCPHAVNTPETYESGTTVTGGRLRVLYAEDNEVNIELVRQVVMSRPKVILQIAETGASALSMALQDPPDLMLVDMHLGDWTGFELARALQREPRTAHIRLVALSADVVPSTIDAALLAGFEKYLTKPINFKQLFEVLDEYANQPRDTAWADDI